MNTKKWVYTVVLLLGTLSVKAQGDIFAPMKEALKAGSAKELVKYVNQSVEINVEGEINTYSKAQAEFVLRDFFKKYPVTDFSISHTGSSKSGLQYAIGTYKSNGNQLTVLIRLKQTGTTHLIHEISFVKE
ncbi:MAG TPA: DUF4783 domain-containing protein [Cyclobacteriaceae bacterium]|jgi:hypothetical protein|nr:DUF4783 domain-containing protein [Cytophagales bacterium]HMR57110.1 DUF4783 domain-containing protein [Cyclobacteriaceae bacterium]HNT49585.1 DUF4783 domain-containing protein [Cyclobacteriaceae bacterium]HRE65446.1 DUF4783 domain-containing protein [Cyclobacteriaceae bacterium]HRF32636.1 DUF4783 domain-containing protein [Cyclobacteriaceae bacterium]